MEGSRQSGKAQPSVAGPEVRIQEGRGPEKLTVLERFLRLFCDVRPGEGPTGLLLLCNIFLVLAAYYLIKPVREGWLSISAFKGLSKMEIKAYSSFLQSMVLLLTVPLYARFAGRLSRRALITYVTLFFVSNLLVFWLLQPGLLFPRVPYAGIVFYLWVGIFSATAVAQFWAFAADLYSDERGKRIFPLIAVGASAGAVFGSWITGRFIRLALRDSFDLILLSALPLSAALVLTLVADRRGSSGEAADTRVTCATSPASPGREGAYRLIFGSRYLLAVACLALLINWVNTNGENILYRSVQDALEAAHINGNITDAAAVERFVKEGTTAFYGDLYFWVNLCGLLVQAFLVSRFLRYGGFATILFLTPFIALLSYSVMALFPVLFAIRVMKIAENSTNYSVNNTARHVIWLPLPGSVIYKAKAAIDTLFMRLGDGLAALTVLVGTQVLGFAAKGFMLFNILLVLAWCGVAVIVFGENRRLVAAAGQGP